MNASKWNGYRHGVASEDMLLGDSTIRDIDPEKLVNTNVHCHRGAGVEQITKDLEALTKDRSTKLDNLKLVVGTNDIANEPAA